MSSKSIAEGKPKVNERAACKSAFSFASPARNVINSVLPTVSPTVDFNRHLKAMLCQVFNYH
jgi:hypothetical protein